MSKIMHSEYGLIPDDWKIEQLEEVCEILDSKRKPIKSSDRELMQGDIPYYGASGIIDYVNDYIFDEELILLGEDGENIVSRNLPLAFRVSGKCWVNNHAHVFKIANEDNADIDYICNLLEYKDYSKYVAGSAQPKITQKQCRGFELLVPPLPEQKKIAKILSTVDGHIDEVDGMIEDLKELKKGLMQKLLTEGIGHTEFKDSEVGRIPKDWEVKPFGTIFETLTDYVANGSFASLKENVTYLDEGYAVLIRLQDNSNGYNGNYVYISEEAYEFLGKSKLYPRDIIISNVGARCGLTFRAPDLGMPMSLAPNSILLRTNINDDFVYRWLESEIGQSALDRIKSTTAQPKFNKTDFKTVLCPIPSLDEQKKIAQIMESVDDRLKLYEEEVVSYRELKKGLMQQLLTGKTRVKIDN